MSVETLPGVMKCARHQPGWAGVAGLGRAALTQRSGTDSLPASASQMQKQIWPLALAANRACPPGQLQPWLNLSVR